MLPLISLFFLLPHYSSQSGSVAPFPLQTCGLLANSQCPGTSGCCTADTCCGGGCCGLTATCINPGTANAACCDLSDPTLCGSYTPTTPSTPSAPSSASSGPAAPGSTQCTNGPTSYCHAGTDSWICMDGRRCGTSQGDCEGAITGQCSVVPGSNSPSQTSSTGGSQSTSVTGGGGSSSSSGATNQDVGGSKLAMGVIMLAALAL